MGFDRWRKKEKLKERGHRRVYSTNCDGGLGFTGEEKSGAKPCEARGGR